MVEAFALAGDPRRATVHPQPATAAGLQAQGAGQVQATGCGIEQLQATGWMNVSHGNLLRGPAEWAGLVLSIPE